MQTHRTPDIALWDHYRALREQWVHEDNLTHHRMSWLILCEGLLFTAYGTQSTQFQNWLILGIPIFGVILAALIGVGIFSAMAATDEIRRQYDDAGLADLCSLAPSSHLSHRGRWAAKSMPFVFGALWCLAAVNAAQQLPRPI